MPYRLTLLPVQFFLPLGLFLGANYTIEDMFMKNLFPVSLGNFVGTLLVSLWYSVLFRKTLYQVCLDNTRAG